MVTNSFQLNTENQLTENFNTTINEFWDKNTQSSYFSGIDDKKVHTISIKTGNNKAIVISQGRNESVLKYKELAFELNQLGYDLYLIDHRGQGFSQRLGGNSHRGHVEHFQDYVDDLHHYISSLNLQQNYQNSYLIAHSMGSTISALYLQQFDHPFQASVFFSPMFSINLGIPEGIAKLITDGSTGIYRWFSDTPCYVFGGRDYKTPLFTGNRITSSRLRFHSAINTFEQYPETQLGSPSMRWVSESIRATRQTVANANKITIPLLIIKAGADTTVTSTGQDLFFKNATHCNSKQLVNISGAKHEILLERDQYRIPALNKALQFFKESQQNKLACLTK